MGFSDGASSLHALVTVNTQAKALFARRPHTFLLEAINCSAMEVQLQQMLCTIISIRQRRKHLAAKVSLQAYIQSRLEDPSIAVQLDTSSTPSMDWMSLLEDTAKVCDGVAQAEKSLIKTQLGKVNETMQMEIAQDQFHRTMWCQCAPGCKEYHLSPTEQHRIRKALWRLRLYFEAFYEAYLPKNTDRREGMDCSNHRIAKAQSKLPDPSTVWGVPRDAKLEYVQSQKHFFSQLTVWELEEMECAWYHLCHQSSTLWRRPCPYCPRKALPDDLNGHLWKYVERLESGDAPSGYGCNFTHACPWFRMDLEVGFARDRKMARWSRQLARGPNAGFEFFEDWGHMIQPRSSSPMPIRNARSEFLAWGYCMWDCARLESFGLLESGEYQEDHADWDLAAADPQKHKAHNSFKLWEKENEKRQDDILRRWRQFLRS